MDKLKLKACPFCGGNVIATKFDTKEQKVHAFCDACRATGPFVTVSPEESSSAMIAKAYVAWNLRHEE